MDRLVTLFAVATLSVMPVLLVPDSAAAADLKVLSLPPMRSAITELIPEFERLHGHRVAIEYGTPPDLMQRLERREPFDVLIATKPLIAQLQNEAKVTGSADVAKVGMGVAVRHGAAKPALESVDAFKRALLEAKSIAYIDPASGAPGGVYLVNLFERLGIGEALKPKTRHLGPSGAEAAVARGEVELALSQITVIRAFPGVELVGPLPAAVQNYLQFTAATAGAGSEAARAFVTFLSAPAARAVLGAKGFEY